MVGPPIEFDTVLDLCRHEHRRIVLATLADQQRSVTTGNLAETVLERGRHDVPASTDAEPVTRIETTLHHVHLPKVAETGIIEYTPERQLVEPTQFDCVEPHLSAILDADPELATPTDT